MNRFQQKTRIQPLFLAPSLRRRHRPPDRCQLSRVSVATRWPPDGFQRPDGDGEGRPPAALLRHQSAGAGRPHRHQADRLVAEQSEVTLALAVLLALSSLLGS